MEIHIGDRVADVTLVSKEGNKVQFMIDGKPYDVDIVMAENGRNYRTTVPPCRAVLSGSDRARRGFRQWTFQMCIRDRA